MTRRYVALAIALIMGCGTICGSSDQFELEICGPWSIGQTGCEGWNLERLHMDKRIIIFKNESEMYDKMGELCFILQNLREGEEIDVIFLDGSAGLCFEELIRCLD